MKYDDALEARDILNKIEALKEFINTLDRKLNVLGTAKVILEIDDGNGIYNDGIYEPSDPIRIKLSDNMVNIIKEELNKELHELYKKLYNIGE